MTFLRKSNFWSKSKNNEQKEKRNFFLRSWLWTCEINFLKACHFLKKVPLLQPTSAKSRKKIFLLRNFCIYSKTSSGLVKCIFNKLAGKKLIETLKISEQSSKIIKKLITKSGKKLEHLFATNRRQFLHTCQKH